MQCFMISNWMGSGLTCSSKRWQVGVSAEITYKTYIIVSSSSNSCLIYKTVFSNSKEWLHCTFCICIQVRFASAPHSCQFNLNEARFEWKKIFFKMAYMEGVKILTLICVMHNIDRKYKHKIIKKEHRIHFPTSGYAFVIITISLHLKLKAIAQCLSKQAIKTHSSVHKC